ncbi:MAG: helix-turn-helix domain-containing protein [Sulfobacillus sp.]
MNPEVPIVTLPQLGQFLRGARRDRKLTQQQLALRVGATQVMISNMETDPGHAYMDRVFRVLAELDLELVLRPKAKQPLPSEW